MLVKYLICASVCQYLLVDLEMAVNTQSVTMICESFDGYEDSDSCLSLQSAIGWLEF